MEVTIVTTVVVEVLKRITGVKGTNVNILALVVGLGLCMGLSYFANQPLDMALVPGVVTGLSATGGYELARRFLKALIGAAVESE